MTLITEYVNPTILEQLTPEPEQFWFARTEDAQVMMVVHQCLWWACAFYDEETCLAYIARHDHLIGTDPYRRPIAAALAACCTEGGKWAGVAVCLTADPWIEAYVSKESA